MVGDRTVTEPAWVGEADGFQVQAPDGLVELQAHLARESTRRRFEPGAAEGAGAAPPPSAPEILPRSAWRAVTPRATSYTAEVNRVIVHHTATTNAYTADDVPRMLRSIQSYHRNTRGWRDIAYNFLVDRFGRIWEGRAGGVDQPVLGGHTQGFNTGSVGIAVLGDFQRVAAADEVIDAVSELAAWRLAVAGKPTTGTVTAVSAGNAKYRSGQRVTFPVISGHRDNQVTSCPGQALYNQLDHIRDRATQLSAPPPEQVPIVRSIGSFERLLPVPGAVLATGWALDQSRIDPVGIEISVDGNVYGRFTASIDRPEIEAYLGGGGSNHGFAVPLDLAPGSRRVCIRALDTDGGDPTGLGCRTAEVRSDPVGSLDPIDAVGDELLVGGWALDPDVEEPVEVDVLVDGELVGSTAADLGRADVVGEYPDFGPQHGFELSVPISELAVAAPEPGASHVGATVCVNAQNVGPGEDVELGCVPIRIPTTPFAEDPPEAEPTDQAPPEEIDPPPEITPLDDAIGPDVTADLDATVLPSATVTLDAAGPDDGTDPDIATTSPRGVDGYRGLAACGPDGLSGGADDAEPGSNRLRECLHRPG